MSYFCFGRLMLQRQRELPSNFAARSATATAAVIHRATMGDEVDDLLRELEGTLAAPPSKLKAGSSLRPGDWGGSGSSVPPASSASSRGSSVAQQMVPIAKATARSRGEVDDLLAMVDEVASSTSSMRSVVSSQTSLGAAAVPDFDRMTESRSSRCGLVYLVPGQASGFELGCSRLGGSRRGCANMLCTSCDFSVLRFEDAAWSEEADYMFFRNQMPARERLKVEILAKKGELPAAVENNGAAAAVTWCICKVHPLCVLRLDCGFSSRLLCVRVQVLLRIVASAPGLLCLPATMPFAFAKLAAA